MKKKVLIGLAASALLAFGAFCPFASAAGFAKANTYTAGLFGDVPESEWYASSVSSAYELGFMKGISENLFSPDGSMTAAEAITIAARVHDAYYAKNTVFSQNGAHWYDEYVSYAEENGIIEKDMFGTDDYEDPVKRSDMALISSTAFFAVR